MTVSLREHQIIGKKKSKGLWKSPAALAGKNF